MNPIEILIIEDNDDDAALLSHVLAIHNIDNKLFRLNDGEEALRYLFGHDEQDEPHMRKVPKVVFLDLKMPKVDGLEVLKQMKSDPKTKNIPVVMMTTCAEEKDIVEAYNYNVNSYVVKPLDFKQFSESIARAGMYWLAVNKVPNELNE